MQMTLPFPSHMIGNARNSKHIAQNVNVISLQVFMSFSPGNLEKYEGLHEISYIDSKNYLK